MGWKFEESCFDSRLVQKVYVFTKESRPALGSPNLLGLFLVAKAAAA